MSSLTCSVNLLFDFQDKKDIYDWQVGTHGIEIRFTDDKGKSYGGTYLPFVATEQGWDHNETITSLLRKGGYKGDPKNVSFSRFTTYRSTEVKMSYADY